eukprot:4928975-Pleurochrysis_carterae.AAC.1
MFTIYINLYTGINDIIEAKVEKSPSGMRNPLPTVRFFCGRLLASSLLHGKRTGRPACRSTVLSEASTSFGKAIKFSSALNNVSNYRHQSWYVHYIVWIVPQQLFMYGNTWRFSTCAIESRGARLKCIERRVICWRPVSAMGTVYNYIDRRTWLPVRKTRSYASSPMEQMMIRICNQEANWHVTSSVFARPKQLRLKQQLCACKLKCEFADELPVSEAVCMLQALRDQVPQ